MTARPEPFSQRASNGPWMREWTTPCCYAQLGDCGEGRHACPNCGRLIDCTIEELPFAVATLSVEVIE